MTGPIKLERVGEVSSTSAILRHRAEAGAGEAALMADRQTEGRGRLGRPWVSPPGNLHLSLLLRTQGPLVPGHWSLLAAVALASCVKAYVPGVRLKWPNDVLVGGGKLAGILLDAAGDGRWLVIGFGVNLSHAPAGLDRAVATLAGHDLAPERFAADLIAEMSHWRQRYEVKGFPAIAAAWQAFGPDPGDPISVTSPAGRIEGAFQGIGPDGALLLDQAGTVRALASGEVE